MFQIMLGSLNLHVEESGFGESPGSIADSVWMGNTFLFCEANEFCEFLLLQNLACPYCETKWNNLVNLFKT